MVTKSTKQYVDQTSPEAAQSDRCSDAKVDLAGLLPLVLLLSLCICVIVGMFAAFVLVYILTAIGLGAIGTLLIPVSSVLSFIAWAWLAHRLIRKAAG